MKCQLIKKLFNQLNFNFKITHSVSWNNEYENVETFDNHNSNGQDQNFNAFGNENFHETLIQEYQSDPNDF